MNNSAVDPESSPKKIAIVVTELRVGGAERCATNLALHLKSCGWAPQVFAIASAPDPPRDAFVTELTDAGVGTSFLGCDSITQFCAAVKRLSIRFHDWRPDLVQSFLFHANVVASRAARMSSVPHFVTGIRVTGASWLRRTIERWAISDAARHVCVSNDVARYAKEQMRLPSEKIVTITNGVDLARFDQLQPHPLADSGIPKDARLITFVGRLDEQKGVDVLLEASRDFLRELPEHYLVIVGNGPQLEMVVNNVATHPHRDRIVLLDWRPDTDDIIAASELFVLPSRWEGMANVLLEAMTTQCCVVATASEGTRELLGPTFEDCTVSEIAARPLSQKIVALGRDDQRRDALAAQNRLRIEESFLLTDKLDQYVQLYEQLLAQ